MSSGHPPEVVQVIGRHVMEVLPPGLRRFAQFLDTPAGQTFLGELESEGDYGRAADRIALRKQFLAAPDGVFVSGLKTQLAGKLRRSAPREITDAEEAIDGWFKKPPAHRERRTPAGRWPQSGEIAFRIETNTAATTARQSAIAAAREQLDELKLLTLPPEELAARIKEILDAIPAGEELAEIT